MGRIGTVLGSARQPRHQFLDWPATQSGLTQSTHQAAGLPYPTMRVEPGGTTGGYAWRTVTFDVGQTCIVLRMLHEWEQRFVANSNGYLIEFLNASDTVIARFTYNSTGSRVASVRSGGSLTNPYSNGGLLAYHGQMAEVWIAWKAATNASSNDGQWVVWGSTGTYAIQKDWLNNDGTSATEQVKKIRVGWMAAGTNPSGANFHVHEVEIWDGQPTDLDVIYPMAGAQFFADTPALVAIAAPTGGTVDSVTYAANGGAPAALTLRDANGERTSSTGTSDAVNDYGELHDATLFAAAADTYDGCLVEGIYGATRYAPPAQILWHRSAASNYKAYLHPMHPLAVTPPGKRGTLTLRTNDTVGELTMEASHGIATGNTIYLYWATGGGGKRLAVTVGTVSGNVVPISGGTGDNLPALTDPVYVAFNVAAQAMVCSPQRFRVWNAREWPAGSGRYVIGLPQAAMVAGTVVVTVTISGTPYTATLNVRKTLPRVLRTARPKGKKIVVGCDDGLPRQFGYQRQLFATRSLRPYNAVIVGGCGHKNIASWAQHRLQRVCGWTWIPHFFNADNLSNYTKAIGLRIVRITCAALRMQGQSDCDWMMATPNGVMASSDDGNILDELLLLARFVRGSTLTAHNNEPINITTDDLNSASLYNGGYAGASYNAWADAWLADKLTGIGADSVVSLMLHELGLIYEATLTTRASDTAGTLTLTVASHGIASSATLNLMWADGFAATATGGTVSGASVPFTAASTTLPAQDTTVYVSMNANTDPALIAAIIDRAPLSGVYPTTLRNHMIADARTAGRRLGHALGL